MWRRKTVGKEYYLWRGDQSLAFDQSMFVLQALGVPYTVH